MLRRTILAVSAVSCVLAIAGCAAGNNAPDTPTETQESSPQETDTPGETDPALKIEQPKDLKGIDDPCTMLKPDQLAKLQQDDQDPESENSLAGLPRCTWFADKYSTVVSLGANQNTGAAQLRERVESEDNSKPIEIDGYPGVRVDDLGTQCRVEIGVADDQFFAVNYFKKSGKGPEFEKGCEFAEKIASEVLKNIPDAQPK